MTGEMTLEILDRAIRQIEKFEHGREIIGFKLNPSDIGSLVDRTARLTGITNGKMFVIPPHEGMMLITDPDIPPGYPEPIRREDHSN